MILVHSNDTLAGVVSCANGGGDQCLKHTNQPEAVLEAIYFRDKPQRLGLDIPTIQSFQYRLTGFFHTTKTWIWKT